jgi:glycosyltransferase involved in cell wall biosynthesis
MVKYEVMGQGKIDVITKYFYPIAGGIEVNTHRVYKALVDAGWQVTVHTSRNTLVRENVLPKNETVDGITVRRYDTGSELGGYMPEIDWINTNVVALHNFNIFHFRILSHILWLKLTKRKKFMLFLTPHGGFNPEWSTFPLPQRVSKYFYHYLIGNILVNLCVDLIRAVSEWERREMIRWGIKAEKIKVIENGLEDEAYKASESLAGRKVKGQVKKYANYIIQIGRIHPIKNFETVIKALPKVDPKLNFVIVGEIADKKYYKSLQSLSKELGVSGRVIFAGVVRGSDKYYLIKKSKMMVHMAIWESFCNVINEALSQGTICIAADNTALKYLLDKRTGFLIPTKDHEKLAQTIEWVLKNQNSDKLKSIRKVGIKKARAISWRTVAKSVESQLLKYKNEN